MDRYARLDSPLHILEPRTKILAFAALIVCVRSVPATRAYLLVACSFATAVLMGISQVPLGFIAGRSLLLLPFILLGSLPALWKGWSVFSMLAVRAVLCLVLIILLTNTTRFAELLRGLRGFGCPKTLTKGLDFLYRYFFVLGEEAIRMKRARDCRHVGRAPFFEELKMLRSMPETLGAGSLEKAKRMQDAMLSRGYRGDFPVAFPRRFSCRDGAFLAMVAAFIALTLLMR